ncbi:class I SAM-dependent methyltransferase [Sphingomonas sp. ASV193]|uniref:class I SAM-dependent methyltransferase n=1 Tax=Sphingomonas sp. ASV193 TaxID=3144405 RepID=UPI0032E92402
MERHIYDRMAELGDTHWWFRARRRVLDEIVRRVAKPPKDARILEVGCGPGHNLAMLKSFGRVEGVEMDEAAGKIASGRVGAPVAVGRLPELDGIARGAYDLVALLDVLEHVPDDRASLAAIFDLLRPGGALLLTVPANPWMFSAHDVAHHHHRRYRKREIDALAREAGFAVDLLTPFNTLLFPAIAGARAIGKLTGKEGGDDALPPAPLNKLLEGIFASERWLAGRVPFPAGVSLVAVLRRPACA